MVLEELEQLEKRKKAIGVLFVCLTAITLVILGAYFSWRQHLESASSGLIFTGTVEARTVQASFKVPGRIEVLLADEGQKVEQGQVLGRVETRELEAKLVQAQGAYEAATGQADQAAASIGLTNQQLNAKLEQAQAVVNKAEVGVANTREQYERVKQLAEAGAASQNQLDQATHAYEAARHDLEAAWGQLDEVRASTVQIAIAQSKYQSAAGQSKQAQGALNEAQSYLDNTSLRAPLAGYITGRMLEVGEMLSAGTPVFEITDLENTYIKVFVDEKRIGRIQLQQQAQVTVDAYPGETFIGTVVWINDAGQFAVQKAITDQNNHDIRSFEVKIQVPNPSLRLKTGMTAYVTLTDGAR